MVDQAEALLYAADRAQHVAEVIEPALASGRHVVSDRSALSSIAYQGYGRGLGAEQIRALNDWALRGRWPDIAILLDVHPSVMIERRRREPDRLEAAGDGFHERVREGYLSMVAEAPERWIVVDGARPPDDVAADVLAALRPRLAA
jgi:dTMP kinase